MEAGLCRKNKMLLRVFLVLLLPVLAFAQEKELREATVKFFVGELNYSRPGEMPFSKFIPAELNVAGGS